MGDHFVHYCAVSLPDPVQVFWLACIIVPVLFSIALGARIVIRALVKRPPSLEADLQKVHSRLDLLPATLDADLRKVFSRLDLLELDALDRDRRLKSMTGRAVKAEARLKEKGKESPKEEEVVEEEREAVTDALEEPTGPTHVRPVPARGTPDSIADLEKRVRNSGL